MKTEDYNYYLLLTWDTEKFKKKPGFMVVCKAILFEATAQVYDLGNNGIIFSSPLEYSIINEQIRKNMKTPYMLVDMTNSIREKKFNGFFPESEIEILQAISSMKSDSISNMTNEQLVSALSQALEEEDYEEAGKIKDEQEKRKIKTKI